MHMIGKWPQQCLHCPDYAHTSAHRHISLNANVLQICFLAAGFVCFRGDMPGRIYSSIMSPTLGIGLSLRAFLYLQCSLTFLPARVVPMHGDATVPGPVSLHQKTDRRRRTMHNIFYTISRHELFNCQITASPLK